MERHGKNVSHIIFLLPFISVPYQCFALHLYFHNFFYATFINHCTSCSYFNIVI